MQAPADFSAMKDMLRGRMKTTGMRDYGKQNPVLNVPPQKTPLFFADAV